MSLSRSAVRWSAWCLAALGAEACLNGTDLVSPPRVPPTTFTLEFRADSEDLASATALGWANGIPGVQVTLTSADTTSGGPRVLQGSDSGTVLLEQLAGGRYVVDAVRWLTDAERAQLPAGDDAVGFVARVPLLTTSSPARISVSLVASRRHGLVISEFKGDAIEVPNTSEAYYFSGYVRLYNNSDTTIYLDGLVVGDGFAWQYDYPTFPCSLYRPYAMDSLGIWAKFFHQLPGRGTDYPLLPGESAVLATDAIDHRPLYPIGLDLRPAKFEFYGGASDVDNPQVPNAPSVGTQQTWFGHGLFWDILAKVVWVARPVNLAAMHTEVIPEGSVWARIPADALLEVMAIKTTYESGYPECPRLVDPRFDRQEVRLLGVPFKDDTLAYKRVQLPFTIGGRSILQHTRTSAWDFITGRRDPFATP